MREVTSTGGTVTVRCGGIGKRRYAVGGGGAIVGGGSYHIAGSYPVGDDQRRPNGWAVSVGGTRRTTIVNRDARRRARRSVVLSRPAHPPVRPGARLMPLEGFGEPAVVRVFAICARFG
jgi:hypothetical protein